MLIYDVLKMDHRMVLGIIDTIETVLEGSRRKDMLSLLRVELNMHANSEEESFYKLVQERVADKSLIDTSEDEHHQIEKQLMKLQMGGGESEVWLSDLRDLRAMLEHHIQKEEGEIFQAAEQVFSHAEAADIAARFLEGKGRLGMENPLSMAAHAARDMLS